MARVRYIPMFKRRREGKTDYKVRKAILLGRKHFITVSISGKYTSVQLISPSLKGDVSLASAHSKDLVEIGWKGSGKSVSGAYLTGLLAGLKASKAGVKDAVLYVGLKPYIKGSRLAAVVKGVKDAGVNVPSDDESLPSENRIKGEHIAEYAKSLLDEDNQAYKARFSSLLKRKFPPEEYPQHFEKVRRKIIEMYRVKSSE